MQVKYQAETQGNKTLSKLKTIRTILKASALSLAMLTAAALADPPSPTITIDPSVPEFPDAPKITSHQKKLWVGEFKGGAASGEAVGTTRKGKKNLSIVCDPAIAEALRNTLLWAIDEQGLLADSPEEAELVITGTVTEFKMEEDKKTMHRILNTSLRADVEALGASGERVRLFRLQSGGERTVWNAAKRLEGVACDAVKSAVGELLKGLDTL